MSIRRPRVAMGLLVAALLVPLGAAAPAHAAPVLNGEQERAATWLAAQVPESGLFASAYLDFSGEIATYVDYGLNLDLQFALRELGSDDAADEVYDAVVSDTAAYTDQYGTRYAGNVGKLAAYVGLNGDDPSAIDGRDLIADLKGLMATDGPETGRFLDSPDGPYQSANTVGQSWGVRALAGEGDPAASTAAQFLLAQQCDDGGFRLYQNVTECESGVDATAFAVQALQSLGDPSFDDEITDAVDWLVDQQAADGSFSDAGAANTNSTGLVARVFSSVDLDDEAQAAADWVVGRQLTGCPEDGAIAPTVAAFDKAGSSPIAQLDQDSFVRATVQAALALDLRSAAVAKGPLTALVLTPSSATPNQGDTITVTVAGQDAAGRSLGDVTCDVVLSSSVDTDTIAGNTVTFNHASPHVITATHVPSGLTQATTVQVTPTAVTPSPGTVVPGAVTPGSATDASRAGDRRLPGTGAGAEPWMLAAALGLVLAGSAVVALRGRRAGAHQ